MVEERSISAIAADVKLARETKAKLTWTPEEIAIDLKVVAQGLIADVDKYLLKGMEAPAKRVRTASKLIETLGRAFRVQSVKAAKDGKTK